MDLHATQQGPLIVVEQDGGYSASTAAALRAVASGAESLGKIWHYPLSDGAIMALAETASLLGAGLTLCPDLQGRLDKIKDREAREHHLRKQIQVLIEDPSRPLPPYPTSSKPPPWRHQSISYHWGTRVESLYVAHKPGLGKTRTATDLIRGWVTQGIVRMPEHIWLPERSAALGAPLPARWGQRGGVLILAPRAVLYNWRAELAKWQSIESIITYRTQRRSKMRLAGVLSWVHITTYDSLECIEGNEYDAIIMDEMHMLANDGTNRFARIKAVVAHARRRLALSGTPLPNQLPSIWSQMFLLDGGISLGANYDAYISRYFTKDGRRLDPNPGALETIAAKVGRISYSLSMDEAFTGAEAKPPKIHQVWRLPMTRQQRDYYMHIHTDLRADILTSQVSITNISAKMMKLLQICQGFVIGDDGQRVSFSSAKLNALREMLGPSGDFGDRRVVIWCRFKDDIRQVMELMRELGKPALCLHGGSKDRENILQAWQTDHRWRVFVGMIQIGIGFNLHAPTCVDQHGRPARCSTTVYYGYDWKPVELEQAMDRVYRGDQVEACLYRYLICDQLETADGPLDPIDGAIYESLQAKLAGAEDFRTETIEFYRRLLGVKDPTQS